MDKLDCTNLSQLTCPSKEKANIKLINKTNHIITISLYGDDFKIEEKI